MAIRKAADTDHSHHTAFERTQYVTSTLRVRNICLTTDETLLLELFSQVSMSAACMSLVRSPARLCAPVASTSHKHLPLLASWYAS